MGLGADRSTGSGCRVARAASGSAVPGCGHRACWSSLRSSSLGFADPARGHPLGRDRRRCCSALPGASSTSSSTPIESRSLEPRQLGVGSGMSQYGWRIGAFFAGVDRAVRCRPQQAGRCGYLACAPLALPAADRALFMGEPKRHRDAQAGQGRARPARSVLGTVRRFPQARGRASSCCCSCWSTRSATRWPI